MLTRAQLEAELVDCLWSAFHARRTWGSSSPEYDRALKCVRAAKRALRRAR